MCILPDHNIYYQVDEKEEETYIMYSNQPSKFSKVFVVYGGHLFGEIFFSFVQLVISCNEWIYLLSESYL